jgi:hypothetical protein
MVIVLTQHPLSREENCRITLLITPWYGPHRKHRFQQFYCCVTQLWHGPCRGHHFSVSPLVYVRKLLPNNGRCLQSHYLATGLHATISFRVYNFLRKKIPCFQRDFHCGDFCPHRTSKIETSHCLMMTNIYVLDTK